MIPSRAILCSMDYDPQLRARVIPWVHRWNAWAGLLFVFDDDEKESELIYMASEWGGDHKVRIHRTTADVTIRKDGSVQVDLGTQPNPDTDPPLGEFKLS